MNLMIRSQDLIRSWDLLIRGDLIDLLYWSSRDRDFFHLLDLPHQRLSYCLHAASTKKTEGTEKASLLYERSSTCPFCLQAARQSSLDSHHLKTAVCDQEEEEKRKLSWWTADNLHHICTLISWNCVFSTLKENYYFSLFKS